MFSEEQRAAIIRALASVDEVILVDSSIEALKKVKPQVFVKGREYEGKIRDEDELYCIEHEISIAFTDEPTYSSTELLRTNDRLRQG